MRVAVLTFWDPWEAPHGGTLRTRAFCDALSGLGTEVSCFYPASETSEGGRHDGVQRVPVDAQTVGHRRWPATAQRVKRALLPMPTVMGARNPALEHALREGGPYDVLVVSHLSALRYADRVDAAHLWLDQSDLWSDFARREADERRGIARATAALQRRTITQREEAAARRAGAVTAAGWGDGKLLGARAGVRVVWLPTALPQADQPLPPRRGDGRTVGYLANFHYHPNVDGLRVLLDHWLPRLRRSGRRLIVAGLASDRLEVPDDVEVLGAIDRVDDFYERVDATVAPVRLGGGMKVKVIESLLKGRPVAATAFAVEGFPPWIRDLVTVVDVERPDLTTFPDGPVDELPATALRPFTLGGFRETVSDVLGTLV
jgi:polysaccharide biosynthesis protein PslH